MSGHACVGVCVCVRVVDSVGGWGAAGAGRCAGVDQCNGGCLDGWAGSAGAGTTKRKNARNEEKKSSTGGRATQYSAAGAPQAHRRDTAGTPLTGPHAERHFLCPKVLGSDNFEQTSLFVCPTFFWTRSKLRGYSSIGQAGVRPGSWSTMYGLHVHLWERGDVCGGGGRPCSWPTLYAPRVLCE